MRSLLAVFLLLAIGFPVVAQTPVKQQTEQSESATPVFDDSPVEAFTDQGEQHQKTLAMVRKAIEKSDTLRPLQKNRLQRRLNRSSVAVRVTDAVTSRAMSVGLISVDFDGSTQQVETMVDWDGLIDFIERLMPLILQLISLFG